MPKKKIPTIGECPAFEVCKTLKATCATCQKMDVLVWKEHVRAILESA
jgi:hypothetical protein